MASWNPALRPNSEDDTATHNESVPRESRTTIEETSITSLPVDSKSSTELGWDTQGADDGQQSEPEDAFFVRHGGHLSYDAGHNPLISRATGLNTTEEASIESPGELKEHPENTSTSELIHAPPVVESAPLETDSAEASGLEENYEPQGESTIMEDATQESAALPLVDEFNSKLDWGTADTTFELDNGTETTPLIEEEEARETAIQWDGADDGFDLGVKDVPQAQQESLADFTANELSTEQNDSGLVLDDWGTSDQDLDFGISASAPEQVADIVNSKNGDVDALWQAAFDDEDFGTTADQSAFLFDDDEGFLDDDGQPFPTDGSGVNGAVQPATQSSNRYAPSDAQAVQPSSNQYAPKEPQFTDFSQMNTKAIPRPVAPTYGSAYGQSSYNQPQRPVITSSAQSFVDKSKGGYASPYDLPTDIIQPKKRVPSNRVGVPLSQPTPPPPRSSSMNSTASVGPPRPIAPPSNLSSAGLSPPSSSGSTKASSQTAPRAASNDFFAELPASSKPRPSGRYTPQPGSLPQAMQPPHLSHPPQPPHGAPAVHSAHHPPSQIPAGHSSIPPQLQQPERLSLYSDVSQSSTLAPSVLPAAKRYSPAPTASAPSQARYSPAPPSAPTAPAAPHALHAQLPPPQAPQAPQAPASAPLPSKYSPNPSAPVPIPSAPYQNRYAVDPSSHPRSQSQSFQPRTSSPLAHHTMSQNEKAPAPTALPNSISKTTTPPPPRTASFSVTSSPRKTSNYAPQYQTSQSATDLTFAPPRRSQTSSPGSLVKSPTHLTMTTSERPSSVHGSAPPGSVQAGQNIMAALPHRPGFSQDSNFVVPTDERAADPLERWKGYPIFKWGLGGTVVTCFPQRNPRYGTGSAMPAIHCTQGEVRLQSIKETAPLSETISKFPGPLKGKGKKKDVLAWLKIQTESLEKDYQATAFNGTTTEELRQREEKILLWKILQVFIENDGKLEGSAAVDDAVRQALSAETGHSSTTEPVGNGTRAAVQSEPVDPQAFEILRSHLSKGDREKAAWHAVDNRLWGHAMLLSSTLSKDIWKQVVQEFVRQEVKKVGENNQAIAALYEVFAGNWEDSIDQLVPVSARAGFQMMNTAEPLGGSKNALEGLDKWRETLLLVLSNRSDGDAQALISLARLLSGYGRTDAAHICCLFARSVAHVGGADDPQTDLVLLGANHKGPQDIANDLDAIILTEVYEFGLSLSTTPVGLPHLQPYKLAHAYALAEYGQRSNAISYCDSIAATVKSSTRSSPYYNGTFLTHLDDLTKRLSQAPKDGSSSWISKPSMDKVSGSLLAKFNSFVSGDDSDAASNHSGNGADVGPFSRIAGSTPQISPTQSSADLYNQYRGNGSVLSPTSVTSPQLIPNTSGSRYAPGGAYAPTSSEQPRSRYDPQTSGSYSSTFSPQEPSFGGGSYMPTQHASSYTSQVVETPPTLQTQFSPPLSQQPYGQMYGQSPYGAGSYQPSDGTPVTAFPTNAASFDQPLPSLDTPATNETTSSGYEPPSMGSYEPPTYQPYQPEPEVVDDASQGKKKKSFMDDDEDDEIAARAAALKKQQRAQADKEAEENFKRAAEADAKGGGLGGPSGDKKGWFGGWFKKDPNAGPGPIKAKLGEENSFFYDPELKKWVNKKGGSAAATPTMATPPPPKGPPSRNVSGGSAPPMAANHPPLRAPTSIPNFAALGTGPPSGPPSRAGTPASVHSADGTSTMPPPLVPPTSNGLSGPPSRPGTGMSNASSIDDLLGAPQARKGGTVKKNKRAGRYIDVMGQK